jgi:hypothetical protein
MKVQVNTMTKGVKNPCGTDAFPFKSDACNAIWAGLQDARRFMRPQDEFDFQWLNIGTYPLSAQNNVTDGDVLFVDGENGQVLFNLPWYYVSRERVATVMKLAWRMKYSTQNGNPGYIIEDLDENGVPQTDFFVLPALTDEQFRSELSINPFLSPLEALANGIDALLDNILPDVANLIPWWAYLGGAIYTGIKTKEAIPAGKFTAKKINVKVAAYGGGTGYLLHRARRSYQAKQNRQANA